MNSVAASQNAGQQTRSFTRLTLVSSRSRLSVAVPDDMSLPELLSSVVREMRLNTDVIWRLEHPTLGQLSMGATPGSLGLLDGAMLYVRSDRRKVDDELVDDVTDSVADSVEQHAQWDSGWARTVSAAGFTAASIGLSIWALTLLESKRAMNVVAILFVGAVASLVAAAARRASTTVLTWLCGCATAMPILGALLSEGVSWSWPVRCVTASAFAAAVLLLAVLMIPRLRNLAGPAAAGFAVVGVFGGVGLAAFDHGYAWRNIAVVAIVPALVAVGMVPWAVVPTSGLTGLARAVAGGEAIPASVVGARVTGVRRAAACLFAALGVVLATCAVVATRGGSSVASALAVVTLVAAVLRARRYVYPLHILALAVPAVAGLTLVLGLIGKNYGHLPGALLALSAFVVLCGGLLSVFGLTEVWRSRARLAGDKMEFLLLVSVIPLVLGVFNVYSDVYHSLR